MKSFDLKESHFCFKSIQISKNKVAVMAGNGELRFYDIFC
jgi:hypothetical protein